MNIEEPTREEWKRLFDAAIAVKTLAPWQWMEEDNLFGVQDPASGEVYYVSVMGALGEHLAVAAYRGTEGLGGFTALHEGWLNENPLALFMVPQLQASFEDRENLTPKDRQLIKDLGYKVRGRQAWPMFRSFRPAHAPWYLEAAEARVLALVLEQVLDVAPRFLEDRQLLKVTPPGVYLVRVARTEGDALVWEDRRLEPTDVASPPIRVVVDSRLLAHLKGLPRSKDAVEVGVTMLPAPVQDRGLRPFFPFVVLVVHAQSGFIMGQDMLDARAGLEDMWGRVAQSVASILARYQSVPGSMRVNSPLLKQVLQGLAAEIGSSVKLVRRLPALSEVQKEFLAFMTR